MISKRYIITKETRLMKKIIKTYWLLFLLTFSWSTNIFAQSEDITIRLEFASVSEYFFNSLCKGISVKDTIPHKLSFPFLIENHSNKKMLFGSNTRNYYRKSESLYYKDYNYGVIGRFLMINGTDTIPLFTDKYNIKPGFKEDIQIWGEVFLGLKNKRMSIFNDLLCRFAHFKVNQKERIYNYLNEARFVYVPVISDYELRMSECENDSIRNMFIYPQKPIEVIKNDPFTVFFIWNDDQENVETYPKGNASSE